VLPASLHRLVLATKNRGSITGRGTSVAEPLAESDLVIRRERLRWVPGGRRFPWLPLLLFATIVALCLLQPIIRPNPNALDVIDRLQGPSTAHPFGTDSIGRDGLARVLAAGRLDLLIGLSGAALAFAIGVPLGLLLGYFRGRGSELSMRALDVIQAFPLLIFALALLAFLGQATSTIVYAIAFVSIPIFIRLVRTETLRVRELPFVEAARSVGNPTPRIIFRHVLPNVITPSIVQFTSTAGFAILLAGALSFLGVGVRAPRAEWGAMIQDGSQYLVTGQWWISIFPGISLFLTVLALHSIGEGVVRMRRIGG
jgi:peptide/nickel transport system permease protein